VSVVWRKPVLAYVVSVITDGFGEFGESVCIAVTFEAFDLSSLCLVCGYVFGISGSC